MTERVLRERLAADAVIFYEKKDSKIVIKEIEGLNERGG